MGILIFLIILSFLVIIHELGHFVAARKLGVKVEEFGMGYPPMLIKLFKDKWGTIYSLNWLPFGGFVRLYGEEEMPEGKSGSQGAFVAKKPMHRLVIVLAGAIMNFIVGVLAFSVIYTKLGIPEEFGYVRLDEIAVDSPAMEAGLKVNDKVTGLVIEGEREEVETAEEFITLVGESRGKTIGIEREGIEEVTEVYVRTEEETPESEGSMGVVISDFEIVQYPVWQRPFRGMVIGLKSALEFGGMILVALGDMVSGLVQDGEVPQEVAGPVGIGHVVQKEGILEQGWVMILNFAAILSINLAIVNLLPIPALDGGRAAFILVELVTRKRVNPAWESRVNTVGFVMLLGLIILVSIRDVRNIWQDQAVRDWLRSVTQRM